MILVTGGAGFIGANFILDWLRVNDEPVINLDKLTYAGNLENLASLQGDPRHIFVQGDIGDRALVGQLLAQYRPRAIVNFAAESHVDRSIHGPEDFIQTNVVGTFHLLEEVRGHWLNLPDEEKAAFRFLHVSTDEVYGSLGPDDAPFTETTPFAPNSPYSASKASSDHLVRAYHHTYGLPVLTTNCSNNYGPYQFPEKLIPLVILNATRGKPLPIYGDGMNVRDWLYVTDHCSAIRTVLQQGRCGETYNVGGWNEMPNIEIVKAVCALLDEMRPDPAGPYARLLTYVTDRPGHDRRYAIDADKIHRELGWKPAETFDTGIRKTVRWYLDNMAWVDGVVSREQGAGSREREAGSGKVRQTMSGKPHERLEAWKSAMELVEVVYRVTSTFPAHEQYGLVSQMRRAAVSVPSNLAEGAARDGNREFARFLSIARGSLSELDTQYQIAIRLGFVESGLNQVEPLLERTSKLVFGLHKKMKEAE